MFTRHTLGTALVAAGLLAATLVGQGLPAAAQEDSPMLFGTTYPSNRGPELDDFAAQQGKFPAFVQIFYEPSYFAEPQAWVAGELNTLHSRGVTGWIEWTTSDLDSMATGGEDVAMRNFWRSIKTFTDGGDGRQVVVAPLPEANLDEHPWSGDPIAYQHAYRRIRDLAQQEGLGPDEVRFAFSMNGYSSRGRSFGQFYPGDKHVDIVAFARLNRGAEGPDGWRAYDDVFGEPLRVTRDELGTSKPIMIAQTASTANGGDRQTWLRDMFQKLPAEDGVIGAIYYNRDKGGSDFRIHSRSGGVDLNSEVKAGYDTWSEPSEAAWIFDGSLDAWVTARGGTPAQWPPATDDAPPPNDIFHSNPAITNRVGTNDPVSNAVEISRLRFSTGTATHALLSRDDKFPDALAGTSLVGDGPLLLTSSTALTQSVEDEIRRAVPSGGRVYLLGGPNALSPDIEERLNTVGYETKRLAGTDRYKTAVAVAEEALALYGGDRKIVLVARGEGTADNPTAGWADSVTGGGYAASARLPVVLTPTGGLSSDAADVLAGADLAVLLGGPGAISNEVEAEIGEIATDVLRVSGTARDLTATAIMSELWDRPKSEFRMLLIDGYGSLGWAYGLPAAGLSADFGAPLLPVGYGVLPSGTDEYVSSCFTKRVFTVVVGGTSVISEGILNAVESRDNGC